MAHSTDAQAAAGFAALLSAFGWEVCGWIALVNSLPICLRVPCLKNE